MRLHEFIETNQEDILDEWEEFARTCKPASATMDVAALRDHAGLMLKAMAADILAPQTDTEQSEKSKGRAEEDTGDDTAATLHGAGRADSGFTLEQMVSEYRALRASVLRLWTREQGKLDADDIEDMIRFNESIDQSLAESVFEFNQNVENAKEMFLAMLGHDLRNPLGAIYSSARFMLETGELEEPHLSLISRIADSSTRTSAMVGDLLDFTRGRLGGGIPIVRERADLGNIVREVVDEVCAARPDAHIEVDTRKNVIGLWDGARIRQALTNLVMNATQHGSPGTGITVHFSDDDHQATISIHNRGRPIPEGALDGLFNPMKVRDREADNAAQGPGGNLGLGLYIAERVVHAHGGRITVVSNEEDGTTFTVTLPHGDVEQTSS